ncbi:MAG: hypothetical protein LBM21_02420, partial [Coriobacteriales bacterium]|nr:hypothetical protein [Coriobacteriales bacterium]
GGYTGRATGSKLIDSIELTGDLNASTYLGIEWIADCQGGGVVAKKDTGTVSQGEAARIHWVASTYNGAFGDEPTIPFTVGPSSANTTDYVLGTTPNIYVADDSQGGSSNGAGTLASPIDSIAKAVSLATLGGNTTTIYVMSDMTVNDSALVLNGTNVKICACDSSGDTTNASWTLTRGAKLSGNSYNGNNIVYCNASTSSTQQANYGGTLPMITTQYSTDPTLAKTLEIDNLTIDGNSGSSAALAGEVYATAVYVTSGATLTMNGSAIQDNGVVYSSDNVRAAGNDDTPGLIVPGNKTSALYAYGDGINVSATGCTFANCIQGDNGDGSDGYGAIAVGAISGTHANTLQLANCYVEDNTSACRGAGLSILSGWGTSAITGCTISGNTVTGDNTANTTYSAGGGIYVNDSGAALTIGSSTITGNTALYGSGIWLGNGELYLAAGANIEGNAKSTVDGSATNADRRGSAIYQVGDGCRIYVTGSDVVMGDSTDPGHDGLYLESDNIPYIQCNLGASASLCMEMFDRYTQQNNAVVFYKDSSVQGVNVEEDDSAYMHYGRAVFNIERQDGAYANYWLVATNTTGVFYVAAPLANGTNPTTGVTYGNDITNDGSDAAHPIASLWLAFSASSPDLATPGGAGTTVYIMDDISTDHTSLAAPDQGSGLVRGKTFTVQAAPSADLQTGLIADDNGEPTIKRGAVWDNGMDSNEYMMLYADNNSDVTLKDCTWDNANISDDDTHGGIAVVRSLNGNSATLHMESGAMKDFDGSYAVALDDNDGAIAADTSGSAVFDMQGGEISGTSAANAKAVWFETSGTGTKNVLDVGGDVKIGGTVDDAGVYFTNGTQQVTITQALGSGAEINLDTHGLNEGRIVATDTTATGNTANATDAAKFLNWMYAAEVNSDSATNDNARNYIVQANTTDVYVSSDNAALAGADGAPTGSDSSGDGSTSKPFATLAHALSILPQGSGQAFNIYVMSDLTMTATAAVQDSCDVTIASCEPSTTSASGWAEGGDNKVTRAAASDLGPGGSDFTGDMISLDREQASGGYEAAATLTLKDITFDGNGGNVTTANGHVIKDTADDVTLGSGSVITDNTMVQPSGSNVQGGGAGIYAAGLLNDANAPVAQLTLNGGQVVGNSVSGSRYYGGGIYLDAGSICTINSGKVDSNVNNDSSGGGVYMNTTYSAAPAPTLSMAGGEVSYNKALVYGGSSYGGGGVYMSRDTSFNMTGGTIEGNAGLNGAGVCVYESAFTMSGGSISDNTTDLGSDGTPDGPGGGVAVLAYDSDDHDASFTMSAGSIDDNTAQSGGGVFNCLYDNNHTKNPTATVNISGGSISGNHAIATNAYDGFGYNQNYNLARGGGVTNYSQGSDPSLVALTVLNITGGTITGNDCTSQRQKTTNGEGVYTTGTLNVGADAKVGTDALDNGVLLGDTALDINVTGDLNNDANINVDGKDGITEGMTVVKAASGVSDPDPGLFTSQVIGASLVSGSAATSPASDASMLVVADTPIYVSSATGHDYADKAGANGANGYLGAQTQPLASLSFFNYVGTYGNTDAGCPETTLFPTMGHYDVYVTDDITVSNALTLKSGQDVTLETDPGALSASGTALATIERASGFTGDMFTLDPRSNYTNGAGVGLTLRNITLDGNAQGSQGAHTQSLVYLYGNSGDEPSTLAIADGATLKDNLTNQQGATYGCAVYQGGNYTTCNMTGGKITGCGSPSGASYGDAAYAGAVYLNGGSFNMAGGTIDNNHGSQAGAIYMGGSGSASIGGSAVITGNSTYDDTAGHGSAILYDSTGALDVSGSAQIGTSASDNGVYIDNQTYALTQVGDFNSDANINVQGKANYAQGTIIANKVAASGSSSSVPIYTTNLESAYYKWQPNDYRVIPGTSNDYVLASVKNLYVSAAGKSPSDGGTGTLGNPFKTIDEAMAEVSSAAGA